MERIKLSLLMLASLGILFLSEGAQASEWCKFQQGQTSVLAYCEQGCCSNRCCSAGSQRTIHLDILIAVCVVAGAIIIALVAITLFCIFRDKKRDKEWEDRDQAADWGLANGGYSRETTLITGDPKHHSRPKSGTDAASSSSGSFSRGDQDFLVTDRASSGRPDSRRGSLQSRARSSTSVRSGRHSTLRGDQESSRHHELSRTELEAEGGRPRTHRSKSVPHLRDEAEVVAGVGAQSPGRPITSHAHSRVRSTVEEGTPEQYPGSPRQVRVRHSDGFLEMNNEVTLTPILRPVSARSVRREASVHFEREDSADLDL